MSTTQTAGETAKHTPEPWSFDLENIGIDNNPGFGLLADGLPLNITVHSRSLDKWPNTADCTEQATANAKRVVACVNACEGINPEAVPELLEAAERMIGFICHRLPAAMWQNEPWLQPARAALAKATQI